MPKIHYVYPDVLDCPVHDKGFSNSGGWKCALLIKGVEVAERSAYYGISGNLMAYLTGPLGQSTATAAENLNFWSGTAWMLPLLGAIVADSFLGRYRTIIVAALIYILGLSLLTLSAVLPSVRADDCQSADTVRPCSPDPILILFFFALYLVAFGQGGFRPCVQAFGADQFDGQDPEQRKAKSSFFNWWNCGVNAGVVVIFPVFAAAFRNWRISPAISFKEDASFTVSRRNPEQFEFLNKALLEINGSEENRRASTPREVEEAKALLRLVPTWITCLIFAIVSSQVGIFFTRQARTMNRSMSEHLEFPAASIQLSIPVAVTVLAPIYDRVFVPVARRLTGEHSGITMLQRIGTGLFLSAVAMLVLIGAADVFTIIGLQEFFYDQVPGELKSVGLSLFPECRRCRKLSERLSRLCHRQNYR
ncbi:OLIGOPEPTIDE TRANSPORTER-RELATED [Salix koriyanagi]|uniref:OLIGOPEPTIDE TRANSPORTER-RELATED n=1 Tax=Salix koriyanagi TaxID=2511006 RepID=A0A9Q0W0P6_9ROSI|nr:OLIGOPEPTIDE TRANSPORTER-RELATED [Salix koriyanagi]